MARNPTWPPGHHDEMREAAQNVASFIGATSHFHVNDDALVVASAAKQSRNGRAVCQARRVGLQRLDYTPRITKTRRTFEIAAPRLRAMARNDCFGASFGLPERPPLTKRPILMSMTEANHRGPLEIR
jgi:hypothetical protein